MRLRLIIAAHLLGSCAVTGTLSITSQPPRSQVTVKGPKGNIKQSGEAPFNINLGQNIFNQDDYLIVEVGLKGYKIRNFVIPKTFFASDHSIDVSLIKDQGLTDFSNSEIDQCQQISKKSLTELSKGVAIAQANLIKGDLQIATIQIGNLITSYPFVSVLYDLQGNIFYLQKQFARALSSYEKSLGLDPQNVETAIMVKKLRQLTGKVGGGGLP